MGDNSRAAGAAAVTVVLWASAFVSIRSAGGHFSPGALALGRLLVASLALPAAASTYYVSTTGNDLNADRVDMEFDGITIRHLEAGTRR